MSDNIIQLNEDLIKNNLKDLVRSSVEETLNALIDHEADELVNAEKYERSGDRKGYRSGHYERNFSTTSGDVTLRVPKLKGIQFQTAIIERYKRRECSVEEALIEMYLAGVSVRRVEDITEALWGSQGSHATISELNKKASREKAKAVVAELRAMKLKEATKKVEDSIEETLTYCDFPGEHWTSIRTNNVIERLNHEIRRRTRVVGMFPDGNSALMLVCARLRHVAGTQWGSKKYMNMKHLEAALDDASIAG